MRESEWMTAEALQGTLGIGRSTFYRRVQSGEIEHAEIGGSKLFRPRVRLADSSQPIPVPRNGAGQHGTVRDTPADESGQQDRAELLALVSGYEARIDSLLVERQAATVEAREARERAAALAVELEAERGRSALAKLEAEHARQLAERDREREAAAIEAAKLEAERAATEARERAAALSAEVERARLELEHARKLAELERDSLEALARAKLADAERIAREERHRREGAEAQLAAARALESLPWWRFGQRRQVRALLAGMVLGVSSCAASRYDDCAKSADGLIAEAIKAHDYSGPLPHQALARSVLIHQCVSGLEDTDLTSPSDRRESRGLVRRMGGQFTPDPAATVPPEAPPQPQSPSVSTDTSEPAPTAPAKFRPKFTDTSEGAAHSHPPATDDLDQYDFQDGPQEPLFRKTTERTRFNFTDSPDLAAPKRRVFTDSPDVAPTPAPP